MTRSRYNKKESLNRLLRVLEDKALTSDQPDVIPGEVLSEDEALSDLAELFENSLPNETLHLPTTGIPFASVIEANEISSLASNTVVISPASHHWAHEYGGIYINTGTTSQAFTANTWSKVTGAFQYYMDNSGGEINCDWNDDRIIIYEKGTYFIGYDVTLYSDGVARSYVDVATSTSGTVNVSNRSRGEFIVTGSYLHLSGGAHIDIPVSGYYVDLRIRPSVDLTIGPNCGQLFVTKMVG
jgi:hypothetical protein